MTAVKASTNASNVTSFCGVFGYLNTLGCRQHAVVSVMCRSLSILGIFQLYLLNLLETTNRVATEGVWRRFQAFALLVASTVRVAAVHSITNEVGEES